MHDKGTNNKSRVHDTPYTQAHTHTQCTPHTMLAALWYIAAQKCTHKHADHSTNAHTHSRMPHTYICIIFSLSLPMRAGRGAPRSQGGSAIQQQQHQQQKQRPSSTLLSKGGGGGGASGSYYCSLTTEMDKGVHRCNTLLSGVLFICIDTIAEMDEGVHRCNTPKYKWCFVYLHSLHHLKWNNIGVDTCSCLSLCYPLY